MESTRSISRRIPASLAVAVAAGLLLIGLRLVVVGTETVAPTLVELDASYATSYASTVDLSADAKVVVFGHVTGVVSEGADQLTPGVATTRFSLTVDRVLKGSPAGTIVIKQTGGQLGSTIQEVGDDPLMVVGTPYVLYLQRVTSGPYAGDYMVLGGGQGRLSVDSQGRLTSTTVQVPDNAMAATLTAGQ